MSRAGASDVMTVAPSNNVYTVLVVVAALLQLLTLVVVVMKFQTIFGKPLFSS